MLSVQSDDLHMVFDDPSFFELGNILDDHVPAANPAALEGKNVASKGTKKRPRKHASAEGIHEGTDERKKIVHRDIERQRRQEMASLYSLLRSHLPLEYIKGKRSVSDQMNEAVNYIKHMQKKIKELGMQRDKLKKMPALSGANGFAHAEVGVSNISLSPCCVTVSPCQDGLEILITDCNEKGFPVSKVLAELLGRGLNVFTCDSARTQEKFLHRIQIEASDLSTIDLAGLQDRLTNIIKPS